MAAQWSNWEDSRQCPVGHPTLPLRYLTEFRHCCSNLPQQQDTIPPWPQHEKLGGWKESGVVPSSMRNWEMYKSHCCCYLYGPCPASAAGTRSTEVDGQSLTSPATTKMQLSITAAPKEDRVEFMLGPATIVGSPLLLLLLLWGGAVSRISTDDKSSSMPLTPPKMTTYRLCTTTAAHAFHGDDKRHCSLVH